MQITEELTDKEIKILELMADGQSNKMMSLQIQLSDNSIETYRYRLFKKMGVRNGFQAVAFAIRNGIIK